MFWVVTRYDDVLTVLNDRRFVADRRSAPMPAAGVVEKLILRIYGPLLRNMLGSDEPDHARLRALVQQAFTMRSPGETPRSCRGADECLSRHRSTRLGVGCGCRLMVELRSSLTRPRRVPARESQPSRKNRASRQSSEPGQQVG